MSNSSGHTADQSRTGLGGNGTGPGRWRNRVLHFVELFVVALIATVLGAVGVHFHSSQPVGINLTIPAQPSVIGVKSSDRLIGIAFFRNGSIYLDGSSKATVDRWSRGLRDCKDLHITVSGTASSAAYAEGSKGSNLQLANDRARSVLLLLKLQGVEGAELEEIKSEADLPARRLLNDHPGSGRDKPLEALSRRADIDLGDLGSCRIVNSDRTQPVASNPDRNNESGKKKGASRR